MLERATMTDPAALAQDPAEPFDVVLADGTPTGRVKPRADIHRDGDWHRALHVWVAGRDEHGQPFLMVQRRSQHKDTWPGRFDATVGGHYRAGESLADTLREVEEEIGIAVSLAALRPLGVRLCSNEREPDVIDREIQDVFLLRDDRPLTGYRPHPAELAALVRFPLVDLVPFLTGESTALRGLSITPGAPGALPEAASPDDFIPTVDRYFLRIAIAARNVLRGDRDVAV